MGTHNFRVSDADIQHDRIFSHGFISVAVTTCPSTRCIDPFLVGHVAGGQAFWLVGGGRKVWVGRSRRERRSITRRFDGRGQRERGLWVECHTKEFCVKVLKFEIVNSRKSSNYFSEVVPRTIESAH